VCHEDQSILICAPELMIAAAPQAAPNGGSGVWSDADGGAYCGNRHA